MTKELSVTITLITKLQTLSVWNLGMVGQHDGPNPMTTSF